LTSNLIFLNKAT
jgi:hypothetical protein